MVLNQARAEAQAELETLQTELARVRQQLAGLGPFAAGDSTHHTFLAEAEEILAARSRAQQPLPADVADEPTALPDDGPLARGDRVWVRTLQASGIVADVDEREAQVMIGSFRLTVPLADLELRERASSATAEPATGGGRIRSTGGGLAASPGMEIDLRGQTVDEMLPALEKYLDDAYLAGLPWVRIIHGKGTGTLRRVVRDELRRNPLVKEVRTGEAAEGGDGVTVVKLLAMQD